MWRLAALVEGFLIMLFGFAVGVALGIALDCVMLAGAETLTGQTDRLIERQAIIERNNYDMMKWRGEMRQGRIVGQPPPLPPPQRPLPPEPMPSPGVVRPRF